MGACSAYSTVSSVAAKFQGLQYPTSLDPRAHGTRVEPYTQPVVNSYSTPDES